MKKTFITLLLVALVASTCTGSTCPGTGQCSGGSCNTCGCSSDPSFPVNQEVCISTPGYISPPSCVIPTLECPTTCPPPVTPPSICVPVVDIPEVCPPPVVTPPTVTPPTVCIPTVEPCVIVAPAPPQLPGLGCGPIVIPGMPSIPKPSGPQFCNDKLTSKFQLTFSYACRKNRDFSSCSGNIIWNDVILTSITPTDYAVHIHTITVYVKAGENKLQFEGTGKTNSYGLTIDNVKLIRDGTVTNIVVNGGFEQPDVGLSWSLQNNIVGWTGVGIEVGWGKIYNNHWNSQVVELDGNHNYQITQKWSFDSDYKLTAQLGCDTNSFIGQTLLFKLDFDYAARKTGCSSSVATSQGVVIWNNVVIVTLAPSDFGVKHESIFVELKAGDNSLQFDGSSSSDSFGLTIDNVRLTSPYCNHNLISNGEFSNPNLGGGYNFYNGGIPHWKALKAEVGDCHSTYNHNWPAATGQCIELDTDKNTRYTQTIHISQFKFNKLLINKSTSQGSQAVISHVQQAQAQGQSRINCAVAQISSNIYCEVQMTSDEFDGYLCQLYNIAGHQVKGLKKNALLTVQQYDCLSNAYVGHFGQSFEHDYTDLSFDHTDLSSWTGYIKAIHGKVIHCIDGQGSSHYLQIAPCTHFEGQFSLPQIGHQIFWNGAQQPCGKTYVKWVTTCN